MNYKQILDALILDAVLNGNITSKKINSFVNNKCPFLSRSESNIKLHLNILEDYGFLKSTNSVNKFYQINISFDKEVKDYIDLIYRIADKINFPILKR